MILMFMNSKTVCVLKILSKNKNLSITSSEKDDAIVNMDTNAYDKENRNSVEQY